MAKELSVIVPCFNNFKLTMRCLAHLFKSSYSKEKMQVIIVDNASTDGTETLINYLQKAGEDILYLKQKTNINFCKSINLGMQNASGQYIMLLNNDAYVLKDCISKQLMGFYKFKGVGIVGAMEYLRTGGRSKDKPFIYFHPETLLDPILKDYKDLGYDKEPEYVNVDIVGSACCIIDKNLIDKIGMFDERFTPCMYEQEDYFLRTKRSGFKILLATKAPFTHYVGATTAFNTAYYQQVIKDNKTKFLKKWNDLIVRKDT